MTRLYLKEYTRHLLAHPIAIACRKEVLRGYAADLIADLKLLARQRLAVTLFHDLSSDPCDQNLLAQLQQLAAVSVVSLTNESGFYEAVLAAKGIERKLIFVEQQPLLDGAGLRINTLTTARLRSFSADRDGMAADGGFGDILVRICEQIESGGCERVHILPAIGHAIRDELFSVEGSGTMIANNFIETFRGLADDGEAGIVEQILAMSSTSGFLKSRPKGYVAARFDHFFVTVIDGIIVGCVEQKCIDAETVELGALAISTRFRNQRIGVYTVSAFVDEMERRGFTRFISLTRNPRLQDLLERQGFRCGDAGLYPQRRALSPGVPLYWKSIPGTPVCEKGFVKERA